MGWDVVQIGLRHNLPVYDIYATAKACGERLRRNIMLVAYTKYKYDNINNIISQVDYSEYELGRFRFDESDEYLKMVVEHYEAKNIYKTIEAKKLKDVLFENCCRSTFIRDATEPWALYEFLDDEFDVRIFEENIDLSVYYWCRWSNFYRSFLYEGESTFNLLKYREEVIERARLFGCNQIIYCADQGPGEFICNKMNLKSEDLLSYVRNNEYIDDYFLGEHNEKSEIETFKREALHINFSDYVNENLHLKHNQWIDVVFDNVEYP